MSLSQHSEGSRVHKNHGLLYRILDEKGNTIGVPIKASLFHNKPTLKYIEERFNSNEDARQTHKGRVKNAIDLALLREQKKSVEAMAKMLEKEGIKTVIRQNRDGIIYGLTYVDHRTKCVFNGSDLGKQYSAKGIQERCSNTSVTMPNDKALYAGTKKHQDPQNQHDHNAQNSIKDVLAASKNYKLVDYLIQPIQGGCYVPHQMKMKKKKNKKYNSNNL